MPRRGRNDKEAMTEPPTALLLSLAALAWVVMTATAKGRLTRPDFALRVLGGLVVVLTVSLVGAVLEAAPVSRGVALWFIAPLLAWAAYAIALPRWMAQRFMDVGMSRWFALAGLVPGMLLLMTVMLLFWPPKAPDRSASVAAHFD